MSEHTDYFAVKEDNIETIIARLRKAEITCFVDNAEYIEHYPYVHDGGTWFIVIVYADMQFSSEGYYFDHKLKEISEMFKQVVSLYESEDGKAWAIEVYLKGQQLFLGEFKENSTVFNSETQLSLLSQFFSVPSEQLRSKLEYGKMDQFCDLVKIPYLQMTSTIHMPNARGFDYKAKGYAIDVRDLED